MGLILLRNSRKSGDSKSLTDVLIKGLEQFNSEMENANEKPDKSKREQIAAGIVSKLIKEHSQVILKTLEDNWRACSISYIL